MPSGASLGESVFLTPVRSSTPERTEDNASLAIRSSL
jgi:hypothetical protein